MRWDSQYVVPPNIKKNWKCFLFVYLFFLHCTTLKQGPGCSSQRVQANLSLCGCFYVQIATANTCKACNCRCLVIKMWCPWAWISDGKQRVGSDQYKQKQRLPIYSHFLWLRAFDVHSVCIYDENIRLVFLCPKKGTNHRYGKDPHTQIYFFFCGFHIKNPTLLTKQRTCCIDTCVYLSVPNYYFFSTPDLQKLWCIFWYDRVSGPDAMRRACLANRTLPVKKAHVTTHSHAPVHISRKGACSKKELFVDGRLLLPCILEGLADVTFGISACKYRWIS